MGTDPYYSGVGLLIIGVCPQLFSRSVNTMLKKLASPRIAVVCLFLLFVLTFWGTVAQVDHGLYYAQQRYFQSFFFLVSGFIPFPGAQLVLWVLFFNLVAATITRFRHYRNRNHAGILLIHFGLLLYFAAAFIILHVTQESNVHLAEGQGTNLSSSYQEWEIAFWTDKGKQRRVTAFDANAFKPGINIPFDNPDFSITVDQFYLNCSAYSKALPPSGEKYTNASGITLLQPKNILKEREKNIAGGTFKVHTTSGGNHTLLLYGAESTPTPIRAGGKQYYFSLRHKKYPLPFMLRLDQFKVEFYPGTQTAKSFESFVTMIKPDSSRQTRIYMNSPLRFKDYTFYQASYDIDAAGRQYSTLAVVKNAGQILPYIASLTVFLGLMLHFAMAAFRRKNG